MSRRHDPTRASHVTHMSCPRCGVLDESGICANCEADGAWCEPCGTTGDCPTCGGTGRVERPVDPGLVAEVAAAGPLVVPPEFAEGT